MKNHTRIWYVASSDPKILNTAWRHTDRVYLLVGDSLAIGWQSRWIIASSCASKFDSLEDAISTALIEEDHGAYVIEGDEWCAHLPTGKRK
jgi:hypothetical protein